MYIKSAYKYACSFLFFVFFWNLMSFYSSTLLKSLCIKINYEKEVPNLLRYFVPFVINMLRVPLNDGRLTVFAINIDHDSSLHVFACLSFCDLPNICHTLCHYLFKALQEAKRQTVRQYTISVWTHSICF